MKDKLEKLAVIVKAFPENILVETYGPTNASNETLDTIPVQKFYEWHNRAWRVMADLKLILCSDEKKATPQLLDVADMPNFSSEVQDGLHSVSEGKIFWTEKDKVTCREHGACNAVNEDLSIWRCLACHEGAYVVWKESEK